MAIGDYVRDRCDHCLRWKTGVVAVSDAYLCKTCQKERDHAQQDRRLDV